MADNHTSAVAWWPVVRVVAWLALTSGLVALNAWLASGVFGPLRDLPQLDFLLLTPPVSAFAVWWIGAAFGLAIGHGLSARYLFGAPDLREALAWRYLACWSPLLLLAGPPLAVALVVTPLRPYAAPWLYFFVDLRTWLFVTVAMLVVFSFDRVSGRSRFRRTIDWLGTLAPSSRTWLELILAATLLAASLATSPILRFQSAVLGDEPKYLRYLENWYRGRGMDITDLGPIADLPADEPSHVLRNARLLGAALVQIASDLTADARRAVGLSAPPPPGPAKSGGGWFVEGKRGGVYQVHNPGLSVLLFPGYYVDRHVLNWTSTRSPQFPTDLYLTQTTVLILYVLWGIALFRVLWIYTGRAALSWVITGVVMLSLPVTAFSYQYYPEVAAGLFIILLVSYTVLSRDTRRVTALGYGFLAGFLVWLHVRFGATAIAAGLALGVTRRRSPSTIVSFWIGLAVPLAALALSYYYISGSLFPWALYGLAPNEAPAFTLGRIPHDLVGFWFDTAWGLVAHAPVYLLALPGLVLAWRRNSLTAVLITAFVVALAVPAAGHGWKAGATTPLRLVAAVVPLVAIPLAESVARYASSRWFLAWAILAAVVSLQNGVTYDVHFIKNLTALAGPTFSGWQSTLVMPNLDAVEWRSDPLLIAWIVATLIIIGLPLVLRAPTRAHGLGRPIPRAAVAATVLVTAAAAGSVFGAATGRTHHPRFMVEQEEVRDAALRFRARHLGGPVWSARQGSIDLAAVFPNPEQPDVAMDVDPSTGRAGAPTTLTVRASGPDHVPAWGTATIDFGDGARAVRQGFVGTLTLSHAFARAGEYALEARVALEGRGEYRRSVRVRVNPPEERENLDAIPGVRPGLSAQPTTLAIEALAVGQSGLEVRLSPDSRPRLGTDAQLWVLLVTEDSGRRRARLYAAQPVGPDRIAVALDVVPAPDTFVSVIVGAHGRDRRSAARSRITTIRWPSPTLVIGAPVVLEIPAASP